jgi:formamidopyrimidine-DNA glycosylase
MSKEIKVTECWTWANARDDSPVPVGADPVITPHRDRPAILMWKEDYDAMRKELEEVRQNWSYACKDKAAALAELAKFERELKEYHEVVKRCECCNKLEYHEFVKSEPEGYYCESCWDDVKG